jgi:hypothetical protein
MRISLVSLLLGLGVSTTTVEGFNLFSPRRLAKPSPSSPIVRSVTTEQETEEVRFILYKYPLYMPNRRSHVLMLDPTLPSKEENSTDRGR